MHEKGCHHKKNQTKNNYRTQGLVKRGRNKGRDGDGIKEKGQEEQNLNLTEKQV